MNKVHRVNEQCTKDMQVKVINDDSIEMVVFQYNRSVIKVEIQNDLVKFYKIMMYDRNLLLKESMSEISQLIK